MSRKRLTLKEARRMALAAQGLAEPRPEGRIDIRHLRGVLERLSLLQLDYVNVLIPAHYQVLFSRLGPYRRTALDELVYRRRELTEQWAHEASIVPVSSWPLLQHRRSNHRVRPHGFEKHLSRHSQFVDSVLDEVRRRGPLTADDLEAPPGAVNRMRDEWGWARGFNRQVLEAHFGFGRLAVADRLKNFQRVYDLPERIVPDKHRQVSLPRHRQLDRLLLLAARAHGVATAPDLADYYRLPVGEVRERLQEVTADGRLQHVDVEGWKESGYLHPEARLPRRARAATLLSPFDPLIWTRKRVKRLFCFDYRVELFVPPARRRWGYYVLPFLYGDELVARVDLKADRRAGQLKVQAAYLEESQPVRQVTAALARELTAWAGWLGLDEVRVGRRGDLATGLRAAVKSLC